MGEPSGNSSKCSRKRLETPKNPFWIQFASSKTLWEAGTHSAIAPGKENPTPVSLSPRPGKPGAAPGIPGNEETPWDAQIKIPGVVLHPFFRLLAVKKGEG